MAPRIPSPGTMEVRMRFLWDQQQVENVYHVYHSSQWLPDFMAEIAGTFKGWWDTYLKNQVPGNCALTSIVCQDLSVGGQAIEYTEGLPIAGANENQSLPNSVTVAVKWGTGLAGRSFQGRTYHIGLVKPNVVNNALVPGEQAILRAAYDALRTALDNATLAVQFCVLSQVHNKAPRAEGICTPISGVTVDPIIDVQRRRLPGRGR